MTNFTKHLSGCALVAVLLIAIFGFLVPMLLSAPSTFLATLGFAVLIVTAIGAVVLIKHVLGLDFPGNDNQ